MVLLVLFVILPVVNGLWDWLSWWISRRLGRDLLLQIEPGTAIGGRAWAVAWHALVDLVAAVGLLAAMAYLLALDFAGYD